MDFNPHHSLYLENLFSDRTFRYRKSIIITSFTLILVQVLDIVPTQITNLGISLEKTDQQTLLIILFLVNLYFLISFIIFSIVDFSRHKINLESSMLKYYLSQYEWLHSRKREMTDLDQDLNQLKQVDDVEEEINEIETLLNEIEELQKESRYSSTIDSKWSKLKEKKQKVDKYFKNSSKNKLIINSMDELFEGSSKQLEYVQKYEDEFIVKHASKLSKFSWFFFAIVPLGLFIYSSYLVL